MVSRAALAGTLTMDKRDIVRNIYECLLMDDARTDETAGQQFGNSALSVALVSMW